MRLNFFIVLIFGVHLASLANSQEANSQTGASSQKVRTFQNFHDVLFKEVSGGLKAQILKKFIQSYETSATSTRFESPWTITSDINVVALESDAQAGQTAPTKFSTLYESRDGYQAGLNLTLFDRSPLNYAHIVPFQGGFTVGKDIIKGGPRSPRFIDAEIKRNISRVQYLGVEEQYLSDLLKLEAMTAAYYNVMCRISDSEATRASFKEIVAAAEVKTSTKTMSLKELLILKDSENILIKKLKNLKLKRDDYVIDFIEFGERAQEIVKELQNSQVQCLDPNDIEIVKNEALIKKVTGIAKNTASVLALELRAENQRKNADLLKTEEKSSLVPYVGVNGYSDSPSSYNRAEGVIGVKFSYNFSGPNKNLEIRSALEQRNALLDQARQVELIERKDIEHLIRSIVRSAEYLQTSKAILGNSRHLLQVIKVQLELGLLDPTTTGQAYLNYSESLLAVRDIWELATASENQLNQYWLAKNRVKEELGGGLKD